DKASDAFSLYSVPFLFIDRAPDHSLTLIPPLVFGRYVDQDGSTTLAANVFYRETSKRSDLAVFPFYFRGRSEIDSYDVVPPLLLRWGDASQTTTVVPPAFYQSTSDGFEAGVVPLWFGGRHGEHRYDLVPPLLFYHSSDGDESTTYALQTYYERRKNG